VPGTRAIRGNGLLPRVHRPTPRAVPQVWGERVSTCREDPKGVHIGGIQFVPSLGYWCAACQRTFDLVPKGEGELLLELARIALELEPSVDKAYAVNPVLDKLTAFRAEREASMPTRDVCMLTWGIVCSRAPVPKPHTCHRWALGHEHRCAYCYTPKPLEWST
jgi:hypothetical protein